MKELLATPAPPHRGAGIAWLIMALLLGLCAPPLFMRTGVHLSTHTMENVAMVTSQETWLRWHAGETGAWMVTSNDGQPRVEKPPMLTWLDFLAWSDLTPGVATPMDLTHRARIVSALLALIMLASIFWLGNSLGDLSIASLAMLVAGSMIFFQRQGRSASYDIHFVAWGTLAVAAAFWAMKPLDSGAPPSRARQIAGWSIAGAAMACSLMSKNPLLFAIVLMPVLGAIVLLPHRRGSNLVGLGAAIVIALLPVIPWYWHVVVTYPRAFAILKMEFQQPRTNPQVFYYYLGLFGLVVPWSAWLICGLIQPFTHVEWQRRRRLLVPWLWFALIFLFFSIPAAKQQRYILPIIPAVALLCAQVLREYQSKADSGRADRLARIIGGAMWFILFLVSLCVGPMLAFHEWLAARMPAKMSDEFNAIRFNQISVAWAIVLTIVLVALAVLGWIWNQRWQPMRSALAMAIWTLAVTSVYWGFENGEPRRTDEVKLYQSEAERVATIIGNSPMRSLRITGSDFQSYKLNEEFRLYFGRLIRRITPEELSSYAEQSPTPVYVLTKSQPEYADTLAAAGYHEVDSAVITDEKDVQQLWRHDSGK